MIIKWEEIDSVNVKELDTQHQQLVGIINQFFVTDHGDKDGLLKIIKELNAYAEYHFSDEEKYFAQFHYEKTAEHQKQHQFYREKISEFAKKIETGNGAEIIPEISKFLHDWWVFHINHSDIEYSDCFNSHGLY
jgi:hemerythrin